MLLCIRFSFINIIRINTSMESLEWTKDEQLHLLSFARRRDCRMRQITVAAVAFVYGSQHRIGIGYVVEIKIAQVFQHHELPSFRSETKRSDLSSRVAERFFLNDNGQRTIDEMDRLTLCERMLSASRAAHKIRSLKTIVKHDRVDHCVPKIGPTCSPFSVEHRAFSTSERSCTMHDAPGQTLSVKCDLLLNGRIFRKG